MTKKEMAAYRQALENLANNLRDTARRHDPAHVEVERSEDYQPLGTVAEPAELGSAVAEQEVEAAVFANEEHLLEEVNAALSRIGAGAFGQCESCGKPISQKRLSALPYARHCIRCAHATETGAAT